MLSVPFPIFVNPPAPARFCVMVTALLLVSNVKPPACTLIWASLRFWKKLPCADRACRVPPFKLTCPAPVTRLMKFVETMPPSKFSVPLPPFEPMRSPSPPVTFATPVPLTLKIPVPPSPTLKVPFVFSVPAEIL